MIVVHIVTTAAASGSVKQDKAMANCDCKWASANSCAPHSNDDSRCWVVCCSGEEARRRAAVNSAWTNRAPHEREGFEVGLLQRSYHPHPGLQQTSAFQIAADSFPSSPHVPHHTSLAV